MGWDSAQRVLSVGLYGCGAAEVLLAVEAGAELPASAVAVGSEAALLRAFARRVRELDPDVLSGWNVADFDLPVLLRAAARRKAGPPDLRRYHGKAEPVCPFRRSAAFVRREGGVPGGDGYRSGQEAGSTGAVQTAKGRL